MIGAALSVFATCVVLMVAGSYLLDGMDSEYWVDVTLEELLADQEDESEAVA